MNSKRFKLICVVLFTLPLRILANDLILIGKYKERFLYVDLGSSKNRMETELSMAWSGFNIRYSNSLDELTNQPCTWAITYRLGKFLPEYKAHRKEIVREMFSCDGSGRSSIAGSTYFRNSGNRFICAAGCDKNPFKTLILEN